MLPLGNQFAVDQESFVNSHHSESSYIFDAGDGNLILAILFPTQKLEIVTNFL